ncbi:MAG: HAD hydrolase family protein [Flavobacteriales bacterium]|nr:HAD hydrolase family protein [Flavobacteriales bacterium]
MNGGITNIEQPLINSDQLYLQQLAQIKTFIFDVDGVYTNGQVLVTDSGEFYRMVDIKDGYATTRAVKSGFRLIIISGGRSEGIRMRFERLGVTEVFLGIENKLEVFEELQRTTGLDPSKTAYMGDDMPDLQVMQKVGLPVCPSDAVPEIKSICSYVSPYPGGGGCVRDILEKALKLQGLWL